VTAGDAGALLVDGDAAADPAPQNDRFGGGFGTGMAVVTTLPFCTSIENTSPPLSNP
jgi:hypothetical protein